MGKSTKNFWFQKNESFVQHTQGMGVCVGLEIFTIDFKNLGEFLCHYDVYSFLRAKISQKMNVLLIESG
jgi:hypothetical protein